jgi:hypothetical protein
MSYPNLLTPEEKLADAKARLRIPKIVVICGSTRFMDEMTAADAELTWAGHIVVKPSCNMKQPDPLWADEVEAEAGKVRLDELHRAKIRLADQVLVVGDYVGDSTRAEIAYARLMGKPIRFLTPEAFGTVCDCGHDTPHLETECGGDAEPFMEGRSLITWAVLESAA